MQENWRPVVGFEGYYEVSKFGTVVRLKTAGNTRVGRVLRGDPNEDGYIRVRLRRPGYKREVFVHVLVAESFLGPKPLGFEVSHKDDDRRNNRADNLEYLTHAENMRRTFKAGRAHVKGERNGRAKVTAQLVLRMRRDYRDGKGTCEEIGKANGLSKGHAAGIISGQYWKHL